MALLQQLLSITEIYISSVIFLECALLAWWHWTVSSASAYCPDPSCFPAHWHNWLKSLGSDEWPFSFLKDKCSALWLICLLYILCSTQAFLTIELIWPHCLINWLINYWLINTHISRSITLGQGRRLTSGIGWPPYKTCWECHWT